MAKKSIFYPTPGGIASPSHFRNLLTKAPSTLSWEDCSALICGDEELKAATTDCRAALSAGNKALYSSLKKSLQAITPAAVFEGSRNSGSLKQLTGVSLCDFDHVDPERLPEMKAIAAADPHTFMLYETPSGLGLRVLFRYTSSAPSVNYLRAWETGNLYFSALLGHPYDKACSDIPRLSFLAHDPDCRFCPDATPFVVDNDDPGGTADATATAERAKALLQRQGIEYAEGNRHAYLIQLCIVMHKWGLNRSDCFDALAPMAPRGDDEARDIVNWVCRNVSPAAAHAPLAKAPKKKKADSDNDSPLAEQVIAFLQGHQLQFNSVTGNMEFFDTENQRFADLTDRDANRLWVDCTRELQRDFSPMVFDRILNADLFPVVDPFAEYFAHLPQWDGADHIGALAATVHTTAPVGLFDNSFRHWLVGMAAGWLGRGSCNQIILTLIGAQGLYKSTFFRLLLPPELSRYFLAKSNSSYLSKDDKIAAASYGLIDFEELDSLREADLNSIKALVSIETISERATYARNRENRRRIASFCATGNNKQFLTDLTGNRRWHPFEVSAIDCPYDHPICYDQLYAQVLHMIDCGYNYWFSKQEDLAMESYKSSFSEPCCEEELLLRYFRKPVGGEAFTQFLSVTEIATICSLGQRSSLSNRRMSQSLQRLGFRPARVHNKRGYLVVKLTTDEINEQTNKMTRTAISGEQEEIF